MQDKVVIKIKNYKFEDFESFECSSELFTFSDIFSITLTSDISIEEYIGCPVEIEINGEKEFLGIFERYEHPYSKNSDIVKISGRNVAGILVDFYCGEYYDLTNITLKELTEMLLKNVPFLDRYNVEYQNNPYGKIKGKKADNKLLQLLDAPEEFVKIEPGMTIFEVLRAFAISKGLLFFCLPNGKLIFGKPKEGGEPAYSIIRRQDNSNVIEGNYCIDISKSYSDITIISQYQPKDKMINNTINIYKKLQNYQYPFYKPYVTTRLTSNMKNAENSIKLLMNKMNSESYDISYTLRGFSQAGNNYRINEIAYVKDAIYKFENVYLITKRVFSYSKSEGSKTLLTLKKPGEVYVW